MNLEVPLRKSDFFMVFSFDFAENSAIFLLFQETEG